MSTKNIDTLLIVCESLHNVIYLKYIRVSGKLINILRFVYKMLTKLSITFYKLYEFLNLQ
jgi:hypothetical protein